MHRRTFLAHSAALSASASIVHAAGDNAPHIATNAYPWMTFYKRRQRNWKEQEEQGLADVAKTGLQGFEPIGESPQHIQRLGPWLKRHALEMRSLYVNSTLHDSKQTENSIDQVLAIAKEAKTLGTRILVTNPSPIRWGGDEDKTDPQLATQAEALDHLGAEVRKLGLTLAYHNHDAELRQGGREFHHMLIATKAENVKLCLDAHWIYRGCGDSQIAVFDALQHYHPRIIELHLRQSEQGVWQETFTMDGDIDYRRLFDQLAKWSLQPHLVLEQAIEAKSPDTLSALEAHQQSRDHLLAALR